MIPSTDGPYRRAMAVYGQEPCARSFEEDLRLHLEHGLVFSTPEIFIMGRPVRKDAPRDQVLAPWVHHENPDAWLVYLAAGDVGKILWMFRDELTRYRWIGWERDNNLRFYRKELLICRSRKPYFR